MARKNSEIVCIERYVKSFGESNWHGPMTYAKARADGLLDNSSGTVNVHTYSEDEYTKIVALNPGKTFA